MGGRLGGGPLVGRGFKGAFDRQLRGTTPLLDPSMNSHRACQQSQYMIHRNARMGSSTYPAIVIFMLDPEQLASVNLKFIFH